MLATLDRTDVEGARWRIEMRRIHSFVFTTRSILQIYATSTMNRTVYIYMRRSYCLQWRVIARVMASKVWFTSCVWDFHHSHVRKIAPLPSSRRRGHLCYTCIHSRPRPQMAEPHGYFRHGDYALLSSTTPTAPNYHILLICLEQTVKLLLQVQLRGKEGFLQ